MVKCEVCGKEFPTERSLSSHKAWHTRKDKKQTMSLAEILNTHIPPDFKRRINLEIDSSGSLKLGIEVEPTVGEEIGIR